MQTVDCWAVDWEEAKLRLRNNTLSLEKLIDAEDDGEEWLSASDPESWCDSAWGFQQAMQVFASMVAKLSAANQAAVADSILVVFQKPFADDLNLTPQEDAVFASFDPLRVKRAAEAFKGVDYEEIWRLFSVHRPIEGGDDLNFATFQAIVEQWRDAFLQAAALGRCMILTVG